MGGAEGAANISVRAALQRGLHVVTANKALLAYHGVELATIAEEKGSLLNFEAAVAGGIPVIKALRESLTGNSVSRIYGIMNGTCNYILTKMEKEGLSFAECLEGSPAARLCRGRSGLRYRGQRHRPQAFHPDDARLRQSDRGRRHLSRRHHQHLDRGYPAPPPISVIASSCSALPSAPIPASSSASIRPWCRSIRSSPRSTASPMRWRSNPTCSANC